MRRLFLTAVVAFAFGFLFNKRANAQVKQDSTKPITGKVIYSATGNILSLLSSKNNYSMLVQAITKARLDTTLTGTGPFTVFAPVNTAFSKLPKTKSDSLMRYTAKLTAVLMGHIVAGRYAKSDLIKLLIAGKGTVTLTAIDGQPLMFSVNADKNLEITDAKGITVQVESFDMIAGNGVAHSLNGVLTP